MRSAHLTTIALASIVACMRIGSVCASDSCVPTAESPCPAPPAALSLKEKLRQDAQVRQQEIDAQVQAERKAHAEGAAKLPGAWDAVDAAESREELGSGDSDWDKRFRAESKIVEKELARPGGSFWSGAFAVLGGILEGAIKTSEFMQASGQLAPDEIARLASLTAAARTIQNLGQTEGADASKIFEDLSTASRALADLPGKSTDTANALQSLATALNTAGQVARNPGAASESNTTLVTNAVSQFVNTYAERKVGAVPAGVPTVTAASAPAAALDQNGCIREMQWLAGRIRTPQLAAGLVSVDAAIRSAGGLNRAILLTRAQIRELEETYAVNNSNAEAGAFPEEFRRMRVMTEDSLLMNRTYLQAFECRRKAGTT